MKRKPTEVRKAEIVEAAMGILVTRGAKRFTAQLIASEVGMSAGGIFRHFANMDEIVEALLDRMEALLFEGFPPEAEDPWERLRAFFEHRITIMSSHPQLSGILLAEPLAHLGGEGPAARVKELKRRSRGFVAKCMQEAADAGALASDVSVEAATVLVLGAILAVGHSKTGVADGAATEKMIDELWRAIETMRRPTTASTKIL